MNSRTQKKKKGTRTAKRKGLSTNQSRKEGSLRPVVASSLMTGVADKQKVLMRYTTIRQVNSLASTYVGVRWYSNALYDVDPLVGSSYVPFFTEWAAMYSYYRVTGYSIHAEITNLEAFPVACYLVNMNTDPGTSGIGYDQEATTHGNAWMIGPNTGKSNLSIRKRYSVEQIVGDRISKTDTQFVGTSVANPADLTYVGLGFKSLATLTNGVYLTVSIQFVAEFFDSKRTTPGMYKCPVSSFDLDAAVQKIAKAKSQSKVPSTEDVQTVKKFQQFRSEWEAQHKAESVKEEKPAEKLEV